MALLHVRDVSLTHSGASHPAVRDVSFDVAAGEVVLVLGPSGSGKSTLALALNGLIPQAVPAELSGSVEVLGRDTTAAPVAELSAEVAMVFQDPDAQLVTGSVLDEVAFAPENLLLPGEQVFSRSEAALRRVGLWERRHENPDRLSGGGRQRLAIACALATGSALIVLDEPTANLDPAGIDDVYDALQEVIAEGDRAVVLVEHNLDAAMRFATRVLVLDSDGRLAYDGPVGEVLRRHAETLLQMGVWLPSATVAGIRLRERGLAIEPLPLTPEDLRDALVAQGLDPAMATDAAAGPGGSASGTALPPGTATERASDTGTERASAGVAVTARGLRVHRGGKEILRGLDLDIARGSLTAVVGANGAGKTTLVQALAGVVAPPRGQVHVDGMDAGAAAPRDLAARVGFVFQNPEHQFIAHTVYDELAHGLRLRRVPAAEVEERVTAMLARFGLQQKADRHPFLLSGGEKRRLSVGTALITRPDVLALDEPTFGQDRARAAELLHLLRDLRDEGTTIVIVTHDLQLVADHATHTVVLADGRVHAAGRTADVLARPGLLESAGLRPPALHRVLTASAPSPREATTTAAIGTPEPDPGRGTEDPYARPPMARRLWLHHLNPLAKLVAVLPAMIVLVFVRDLATPAAFLLLAYAVLVSGARLTARTLVLLFLAVPAGVVLLGLAFSLWVHAASVDGTEAILRIGDWTLYSGAVQVGLATALRLGAILALALVGGLTTTGPDLVRAGVQQLGIPYRIGYTALAAYRFVPRFGHELAIIRAAHRVRGHHGGRGPVARTARVWGYAVPLLAGAIRHAERVALAMDSRAFGAHPTRTERHLVPFRARDTVFVVVFLVASAALLITPFPPVWVAISAAFPV